MQLFDPNNPNEKKKMFAAAVLGLGALIVLGYLFLGGSSQKPSNRPPNPAASPTSNRLATTQQLPIEPPPDEPSMFQPIVYNSTLPAASEADRNIFAYYVPPPKPVKPPPTPTPTPTPPLTVTSVSPNNVYARTGDFSLQVMGDKFTPAVRIIVDGRALSTRFINSQQIATTVTADLIANPGNRQIVVKNADGSLYSLPVNLNVAPPPAPNFNYVGLIGKPRFNDTAVLQDKSSKDFLNVQRGDVVGGRFRVTSISDKEVILLDTQLKIRWPIAFSSETGNSQTRPPTRRPPVDDEP